MKNLTKRVENKFVFNPKDKYKIINNLLRKGFIEIYQERHIKSIYFDTRDLKTYLDSVEGNIPRKKIRIRSYDNFASNLNFEVKEVNEYGRFKYSEKILKLPTHLTDSIYRSIYPVVEVEYFRKYFSNNLIRLTLDFDIQYKSVDSKSKFKSFYLVLESKLPDESIYNEKVNDFKLLGSSTESFSKYKEAINIAVLNSRK